MIRIVSTCLLALGVLGSVNLSNTLAHEGHESHDHNSTEETDRAASSKTSGGIVTSAPPFETIERESPRVEGRRSSDTQPRLNRQRTNPVVRENYGSNTHAPAPDLDTHGRGGHTHAHGAIERRPDEQHGSEHLHDHGPDHRRHAIPRVDGPSSDCVYRGTCPLRETYDSSHDSHFDVPDHHGDVVHTPPFANSYHHGLEAVGCPLSSGYGYASAYPTDAGHHWHTTYGGWHGGGSWGSHHAGGHDHYHGHGDYHHGH